MQRLVRLSLSSSPLRGKVEPRSIAIEIQWQHTQQMRCVDEVAGVRGHWRAACACLFRKLDLTKERLCDD
jgi:hypothetical protein